MTSLADFLTEVAATPDRGNDVHPDLDPRRPYLDGVLRALSGLYVHMPFKRARHGANPIERLNALALNLPSLTEQDFQQALLRIFLELHDPHTLYVMPEPFKSATAFLPFTVAICYSSQRDGGAADPDLQFVVTRVARGLDCPGFAPGARITEWNGVPMAVAAHQMALRENGANRHASFARAIDSLSIRPLSRLLPPDGATIAIGFEPASGAKEKGPSEAILDWSVRRPADPPPVSATTTPRLPNLRTFLFGEPPADGWIQWGVDLGLEYKTMSFPHPTASDDVKVGLIRISTFRAKQDDFTDQFALLAEKMATDAPLALIVDVRGNSGGVIQNGERILQMLTPGPITPASFQFLNTPLVRDVATHRGSTDLAAFGLSEDTGTIYSRGAQITSTEQANSCGQRYYGRVAIIVDALCYSTTDIFAAGFQDHRIGPVVGVDRSTGAGGANVWKYNADVAERLSCRGFNPLPGDIRISVRQCLRTGRFQGQILEDFGVAPDYLYFLTEKDLFETEKDRGLYEFAFQKLLYGSGLRQISVDLKVNTFTPKDASGRGIEIHCQTSGVSRCEVLVNGKVSELFEAHPDGCRWQEAREVDNLSESFQEVEVRCYEVMPKRDAPFYTEAELRDMRDGDKRMYHLVASRKLCAPDFQEAEKPAVLRVDFLGGERKRRILYHVRGYGRASAVEALTVVDQLERMAPDVEVRFASYGTGANTLREAGKAVLDLELPDRPRLFQVQQNFTKVLRSSKECAPQLIVAHEEAEVARLAAPSQPGNTRRGPDFLPCPCVLVTADLDRPRWHDRETLLGHLWGTVLAGIPDDVEDKLLKLRVKQTGPILRPLRFWRNETSEIAHLRFREQSRKQAREALGVPEDELVVSVFIDPCGRTELAAPIYRQIEEAQDGPFSGKRLLWDRAAGTREGLTFDSANYDLVMAATDLAITKGDRNIELELAYMGVPTTSISRTGLMRESFSPERVAQLASAPDDGARLTAQQLLAFLDEVLESPVSELGSRI